MKILLADDEQRIHSIVSRIADDEGYELVSAYDGAQVLDPLVNGGLRTQLALVLVVAQPEIRWAGDDAVDAAGLEHG